MLMEQVSIIITPNNRSIIIKWGSYFYNIALYITFTLKIRLGNYLSMNLKQA